MQTVSAWIVGAIVVVLGVLGLFLSAYADDGVMHFTGLLIAGFAVLFVFGLIGGNAGHPAEADALSVGESADRAGDDEQIRPLAAEAGIGVSEGLDPGMQPGKVVDGPLHERPHAVV